MTALDAQSQNIVNAINSSGILPFSQFSPSQARSKILALRPKSAEVPAHEMFSVSEETVSTDNGGSFLIRLLQPRPRKASEMMPMVIYFHGGGFFAGGLNETDHIVRQIAKVADVMVANVDYHLSPEVKFPTAVNEAYAALRWVAANASRLGVDVNRIVLAGDSAGGNLAAVTCLMSRENNGPVVRSQVLIYPGLDVRERPAYGSRTKWGNGSYILSIADIEWMRDNYLNDGAEGNDWRASPVLATSFADLPPALVITADHDPLSDEGKSYADKLAEAGVPAECVCFQGTFHGFVGYSALLEVGARAMSMICEHIKQTVQVERMA